VKRILAAAMMLALAGQIGAGPVWAGKHHAKRAFRHHKGRSGRSILLANTTPEPPTPRPSPHYNPDMHGAVPEPSSTPRSQWERDFQEKVKRGLEKPRRMPPHEPMAENVGRTRRIPQGRPILTRQRLRRPG